MALKSHSTLFNSCALFCGSESIHGDCKIILDVRINHYDTKMCDYKHREEEKSKFGVQLLKLPCNEMFLKCKIMVGRHQQNSCWIYLSISIYDLRSYNMYVSRTSNADICGGAKRIRQKSSKLACQDHQRYVQRSKRLFLKAIRGYRMNG